MKLKRTKLGRTFGRTVKFRQRWKVQRIGRDDDHVLDLFDAAGINAARYETPRYQVSARSNYDEPVGALIAGRASKFSPLRFSVAVDPAYRKKGVARQLVRKLQKSRSARGGLEAWVVNPKMAQLLSTMGFSSGGSEWSQDDPFMEWP